MDVLSNSDMFVVRPLAKTCGIFTHPSSLRFRDVSSQHGPAPIHVIFGRLHFTRFRLTRQSLLPRMSHSPLIGRLPV